MSATPIKKLPPLGELKRVLDYNPETGEFTRVVKGGGRSAVGSIAGYIDNKGYRQIYICKMRYLAHRLAWLFVTGNEPKLVIDHINGSKADNRFSNLREASVPENFRNAKISRRNTSGIKGVAFNKRVGAYMGEIMVAGRRVSIGRHETKEAAAAAMKATRTKFHGEFANHG